MQIKTLFLLLFAGAALAQAEGPSESPFERSLTKARSSCGSIIVKKTFRVGLKWEDKTALEEFKKTSQWILSQGSLNPGQLRRFIEIAPISSANTNKLLVAYDKRQEVIQIYQSSLADFILDEDELLLSLITVGKMRNLSREFEDALVDAIAGYLPLSRTVARMENPFPGRVLGPDAYRREHVAWQKRFSALIYSHWHYGVLFDEVRRSYYGEVGEPT